MEELVINMLNQEKIKSALMLQFANSEYSQELTFDYKNMKEAFACLATALMHN